MSDKEQRKAPVLRFKGFTDDWEQRKLKDLVNMHARIGWQGLRKSEFLSSGNYYIITGTDFDNNRINLKNISYISKDRYDQDKNIQVHPNDILLTKDGTIGKVAYVDSLDKPATLNAGVYDIKNKSSELETKYLFHYLTTNRLLDYAKKSATGGTIKHLNQKILVDFPIEVSSKNEEKNIANLLDKIDKIITLQQRKLKELKQIKGSLLTKILAGKNSNQPILRFRNFKNNWKQYRLKDLYTYSNGKAHEQSQQLNGKYELINLNSISIDGSLKSSGKYVNKSKDILKKNDLVMVLSDIAHGLLLGRVAVIPKDNKYVLNQRIALLRPQKNDENSNFMASLINNNQSYFYRMGSGTSQLNISKSAVTESKWFIPEPDEQLAIGNLLKEIDNYIFLQQDKINQLTALRKFLSQNLFI